MNIRNFFKWVDDFILGGTIGALSDGTIWAITDTSSAGAPTYAVVNPSVTAGEFKITLAVDTEAENVCLNFGDVLAFDIDKIRNVKFRVKTGAATMPTASMLAFGLQGARDDAIDSIAQHVSFRVIGADSTTLCVVESDDGTTDNDDVATGQTLINAYKDFEIDFSQGTADVRLFIDGQPVATGTTFNMSAYTGGLQPYVQLQKTSSTNAPSVTIDYVEVTGVR